jgi:hypothetical protein
MIDEDRELGHTEDSEMNEPRDVSGHTRTGTSWTLDQASGHLLVRAVEITETVGSISRTTRYEFEEGHPVEIACTPGGEIYIVSATGKFPWGPKVKVTDGAR